MFGYRALQSPTTTLNAKTVVGAASKKSLLVAGAQMHIFSMDVFIFARVVKLKPKRTQVDSTNSLYTVLYKMTLK